SVLGCRWHPPALYPPARPTPLDVPGCRIPCPIRYQPHRAIGAAQPQLLGEFFLSPQRLFENLLGLLAVGRNKESIEKIGIAQAGNVGRQSHDLGELGEMMRSSVPRRVPNWQYRRRVA